SLEFSNNLSASSTNSSSSSSDSATADILSPPPPRGCRYWLNIPLPSWRLQNQRRAGGEEPVVVGAHPVANSVGDATRHGGLVSHEGQQVLPRFQDGLAGGGVVGGGVSGSDGRDPGALCVRRPL